MSNSKCRDLADQAWELVERGDLTNARDAFTKICELDADDAEAWMMVGTICGELGQLDDATGNLEKAIKLDPEYADAYLALAKIRFSTCDNNAALENARKATELDSEYAEAWATLGSIYTSKGENEEAEAAALKAIAINPQLADAHMCLGLALQARGQVDDAVKSYQQVLKSAPDKWEAHYCLGKIAQAAGDVDSAMSYYQSTTRLNPGNAEALAFTGMLLLQQNKLAEAKTCIDRALEVQPDLPIAIFHCGLIAQLNGDFSAAVELFRKVLEKDPDNIEAQLNLASALQTNYRLEEVRQVYERILELLPAVPKGTLNNTQISGLYYNFAKVLRCQGAPAESIAAYREALKIKPDFVLAASNLLHTLHYLPGIDPDDVYQEHLQWARTHAEAPRQVLPPPDKSGSRRLRVGYVSPDFRKHSVAHLFEPLLRHHDSEKFEIFCYSDAETPDEITDRFQTLAEHWRSTRDMDTDSLAATIAEDKIDILVDLAGHTEGNRLQVFARRAAPVQITYLGYPDTTGLSTMDFRITDEWADPPGKADSLNSETLLRLPRPFICYGSPETSPPTAPSPFMMDGNITFGSLNNLAKINSDVVKVWARILQQVPGSRLLLKNFFLADTGTGEKYYTLFQQHGIESSRIELYGPTVEQSDHLDFYNQIDIALDTFPYNGTVTTCETLWMAVPMITLKGDLHAGRVGASILNDLDLGDLIASTQDDYVSKACSLANDPEKLISLRSSLRDRFAQSRLCDGTDLARSIETAYTECREKITTA